MFFYIPHLGFLRIIKPHQKMGVQVILVGVKKKKIPEGTLPQYGERFLEHRILKSLREKMMVSHHPTLGKSWKRKKTPPRGVFFR